KLSDDEKALLDLTNAERAKEKLPPLTANPLLFQAARAHSANMAKKGEMKHVLDGKGVEQRLDDVHYDFRKCGENIGWSDGASLAEIMKGWMDSKAHRDHILEPAFTDIGIGVARSDKGEYYYTQVFGVPFEKER
ncbi:MAG TPA: CAP domain-containing protein, partial [Gemmataceae bacterium]|nr:CAP domain-containing protein [Gemmataceae bacterium]